MEKPFLKKQLLFVFFIVFSFLLFGETDEKKIPDETNVFLDGTPSESIGTPNTDDAQLQNRQNRAETNSILLENTKAPITSLLQLLGALLVISILAYIVIKILKKSSQNVGLDDPYLKNVSSIGIAQGKSLHVITLGEKAYLIGVTDSSITKIGEVDDKDLIDAMNLNADKKNASPKKDFVSILSSFLPQIKQKEQNGDVLLDSSTVEFFAKQSSRLDNSIKRGGNESSAAKESVRENRYE